MPERLTDERLVAPHDGGCWYCHKADENLLFSIEWDAYVHPACVREALERDPQDDEAWAIARELGIAAEIITELLTLRKRVDEWADRYSNLLRQYEALLRGATMWRQVRGGAL